MKPGKFYEDQAICSPKLIEKEVKVEEVYVQRKGHDDMTNPNSVSALGLSQSPSSKMHGNHSNALIVQADLMHNEYLTRLTEQAFGLEE